MPPKKSVSRKSEPMGKRTNAIKATPRRGRASDPAPVKIDKKRKAARFEEDESGEEGKEVEGEVVGVRNRTRVTGELGREKKVKKDESGDDEVSPAEEEDDDEGDEEVEEDEEEEEEEEERVEQHDNSQSQSAVVDKVVKSVSAKMKASRKSNTASRGKKRESDGNGSKEVQKLDALWDDLRSRFEKLKDGDNGTKTRAQIVKDITSRLEATIGQALEETRDGTEEPRPGL
ncbi:hypothetical protein IAR55_002527 [Kwoniella newhampshirensis]|uniref:Ribosome assembly protein 3 n=1 Tax=Kwoniella newhampshirensis TaxID=1651941 RepID=A0AAW0Z1P9_9TREE